MVLRALIMSILVYAVIFFLLNGIIQRSKLLKIRLNEVAKEGCRTFQNNDILNLPFSDRILKPLADNMIKAVASVILIRKDSQQKMKIELAKAGIKMSVKDYAAMNLLIIILFAVSGFILGHFTKSDLLQSILYSFIGLLAGYTYRKYSLSKAVTNRKARISNFLPDVLDILSVSVSAGLGFNQALSYVVEKGEGDLIDELDIVQREISFGRSRKESLLKFSERCDLDIVKMFVGAVIQADELGISMQNVLNAQSNMIRLDHKQKIEEKAMKIPVKILIPMVLFIFPVIFIILLGPAVPALLNALQQ